MSDQVIATVYQPDPAISPIVGSTVNVDIGGVPTLVGIPVGMSGLSGGDRLIVAKFGSAWYATVRVYDAPTVEPAKPPAPTPNPGGKSGTSVFGPVQTASYRGSWRTDNDHVYQGEWGSSFGNNTGCAFYGSAPRSLAGATITSASVRIRRLSQGGMAAARSTTLWLITQATKPAGAPARGSSTAGPSLKWGATVNSFTIPTSWVAAMAAGTAGGLGVFESDSDPYVILAGRSAWSAAWTLTVNWSR